MIQIVSARRPFTDPRIAFQAVTALARAEAMGLIPADERIETLDLPALRKLVQFVHRAGIGRTVCLVSGDGAVNDVQALERQLQQLNAALEESPVPEYEWKRLVEILGVEPLARLTGASVASVRRYKAAARTTPDEVAARLHFLTLMIGDLRGAYNDIGIRQWFERKRVQLGGRAPAQLLRGAWNPAAPGAAKVRELARSLTASPAT